VHEYGIAASLLRMVATRARDAGAERVTRVEIRVGAASGVETELLETAWEGIRTGTLCADARLLIHTPPAVWRCALCRTRIAEQSPLRCPTCDHPAVLDGGDDLLLERFDIERG
jgi:hydrogenase nickel incorporation protein HypA/HybF